ncbi:type III secretion system cytoplasmic ring protein SctQ [Burkholderia cenocepacia]|uniref:type III secretion system cytoplasmic ring protein SctQ n=1 Tax=Burkholderia cenocepacia TaxID=95486 RepID=UPI001B92DC9F|nr:type III secretion system cytoplasmic ring protein SctQ [Burkholderia cenocepacia]MBR8157594.1 type III secretion system cytoplasmic ring protein SctQ [Burkholderia cenocepacia]
MNATGQPARHPVRALRDDPNGLPRIDAELASVARLLGDARLDACVAGLDGAADWRLVPGDVADGSLCWVALQYDGALAWIGLNADAHPALAALADDDGSPLSCAIAGLLLTPLIDLLDTLGAVNVSIAAIGRHAPVHRDGRRAATVGMLCVHGAHRHACRIGPADPGWIDLLERRMARHPAPLPARLGRIRVPGYLIVGEKALPIATLRRLRPGDVVLRFADPAFAGWDGAAPTHALALRWGVAGMHQYVAHATLDGPRLVLDTEPAMTDRNDHPVPGAPDAETQTSLDELELPVSFEIETVTLPLAQLSALRPGYVIELRGTLRDARIRLLAYGQLIGIGELVTVGEQLGVRVIDVFGSHDAD